MRGASAPLPTWRGLAFPWREAGALTGSVREERPLHRKRQSRALLGDHDAIGDVDSPVVLDIDDAAERVLAGCERPQEGEPPGDEERRRWVLDAERVSPRE